MSPRLSTVIRMGFGTTWAVGVTQTVLDRPVVGWVTMTC